MYACDDSTAFEVCQYMVSKFFMQTLDIVFVILVVSMNIEYFFQYNGNIIELFLSNYFKSFPNSTRIINFP